MEGVHEKGVGWFWRKGSAVGGEGDNGGPWKAFSSREVWDVHPRGVGWLVQIADVGNGSLFLLGKRKEKLRLRKGGVYRG